MPDRDVALEGRKPPRTRSNATTIITGTLAVLLVLASVFTLATRSPAVVPKSEPPEAFLSRFYGAIQEGDSNFLMDRLNPAVITAYGRPACLTSVSALHLPATTFTTLKFSPPAMFSFSKPGQTPTEVPNTIAVTVKMQTAVNPTSHVAFGTSEQVIHIAPVAAGFYTWFAHCNLTRAPTDSGASGSSTHRSA